MSGGFFYGHIGAFYVSLILISGAAVALTFFEKRAAAGLLAVIVLLIVLLYWWLNGYRGTGAWIVFFWNTLPSWMFAGCGVANWII